MIARPWYRRGDTVYEPINVGAASSMDEWRARLASQRPCFVNIKPLRGRTWPLRLEPGFRTIERGGLPRLPRATWG